MIVLLSALALSFSAVAMFVPFAMYTNTDASLVARWAVSLWAGSAAIALWYFAILAQEACR